ncbi:hypothetical protein [Candidatus Neptunochlamydia vexilliferae]|uniref:hypothetical protein n=1 Tax=Candidatus Neptunichlamydia vexilliferae TaxID=1651774 RepID=UPI0018915286|nr:hypothetical protein [Candidatus Neptunochlamydia vexilliferae]
MEKVLSPKPFLSKEEGGYLFLVGERDYIEKLQPIASPLITLDLEDDEKDYFGIIAAI